MPALASSHLASAEYDEAEQTLTIEFTAGESWEYEGVPERVYHGLLRAASPGRYFQTYIKGAYPASEV